MTAVVLIALVQLALIVLVQLALIALALFGDKIEIFQ